MVKFSRNAVPVPPVRVLKPQTRELVPQVRVGLFNTEHRVTTYVKMSAILTPVREESLHWKSGQNC